MGPVRQPGEETSAYRFRYAKFCAKYLAVFAALLCALLFIGPSVAGAGSPFLVAFSYIALPMAVGMTLLGTLGFVVGGWWATRLEASSSLSRSWKNFATTAAALILLPVVATIWYLAIQGLLTQQIPLVARGPIHVIQWEREPLAFVLNMGLMAFASLAIPCHAIRKLRQVWRPDISSKP